MINISDLRENPDKYIKGTKAKQYSENVVDKALKADEEWRELLRKTELLRKERNELSKNFDKGNLEEAKKVKDDLRNAETKLKEMGAETKKLLMDIPNPPAKDVKEGKNDKENEVIEKVGEKTTFDFEAKDYLSVAEGLDIIDIERAGKVSGSRFGYLKGDAVLLEFALINLASEVLTKEGFIPVVPPVLIKKEMMEGMGYLEHRGEEDMYVFDKDQLVLVGTSEQSIGPMHSGEILKLGEKPLRYMGFSTCFRREAGSYGKDTKGIIRVHQFDKVEMFSITKPSDSDKEHEFLLSMERKLFDLLEIPYQVVKMCSGDLGAPATRKYDLEAWMPGQNTYREVTSTSNTTDFQSRRLNIKYQTKDGTEFVHMLNGTAFAVGRTLVAIIENYQTKEGEVKVPEALQKWVGKKIISKRE